MLIFVSKLMFKRSDKWRENTSKKGTLRYSIGTRTLRTQYLDSFPFE